MTVTRLYPLLMVVPLAAIVLMLPAGAVAEGPGYLIEDGRHALVALLALALLLAGLMMPDKGGRIASTAALGTAGFLAGLLLLLRLHEGLGFRWNGGAAWTVLLLICGLLWVTMERLSALPGRITMILVPAVFGGMLVYFWEIFTVGFSVPQILLPAPSVIYATFMADLATLWVDFEQTYIRSAVPGFLMGCGAGFLTAIAIDRSPFLQRGLLPLGSLVSAMPIVGIAPIMVMWFGFDWHSKAAVVVVMTFFPMLVNTTAGLQAASAMEHDLMRSYAASYGQALVKLRLPTALPHMFNALKLNSTLALIGAIVAEFFGTPIYGMGFRISTEVQRLNVDKVWATIAVAALAGSISYGLLALLERKTTFWHPSQRKANT